LLRDRQRGLQGLARTGSVRARIEAFGEIAVCGREILLHGLILRVLLGKSLPLRERLAMIFIGRVD
jgi:hypothetical protein